MRSAHEWSQWAVAQTASEIDPMLGYSFRKPHILNKVISCWQKSIVLLLCLHHDGRQTWPDQVRKQSLSASFHLRWWTTELTCSRKFIFRKRATSPRVSGSGKAFPLRWHAQGLVLCLRAHITQPRPVFMGKIWSPANCLVNTMLNITAAPFVFRWRTRFVYHG